MTEEVWESSVVPWDDCSDQRKQDLTVAWSLGKLRYKLHPDQRKVYDDIKASWERCESSADRVFTLDIGRQWGKDYLTGSIAVEALMRAFIAGQRARFPFGAPTRDEVKELLVPTLEEIFSDCPPQFLPQELKDGSFRKSANHLTWPGGGQRLVLVGCDIHPNRLRGPSSIGFALTEAGFMDVNNILQRVLLPQLIHSPDGFGIMNSTPPESPAHPWTTEVLPEARARGMYAHRTIEDNPMLTQRQVDGFIRQLGGRENAKCRRELFAEHIVDETLAIVPEFQEVRDEVVTDAYVRPAFFDAYVSLDPGWSHKCACLFGFVDFEGTCMGDDWEVMPRLVIEDAFAIARANSSAVADEIKRIEEELWAGEQRWSGNRFRQQPYLRVSDTDLRMIADLGTEHGLLFAPTRKDDRDAAINALRLAIQRKQIIINPRAEALVADLDHAIWAKNRKTFEESEDFGHFDCLAALVYLHRNVQWRHNPMPPGTVGVSRFDHTVPVTAQPRSATQGLLKAFPQNEKLKKRGRGRPFGR